MSKQRPSKRTAAEKIEPQSAQLAGYWRKRIFRNSYTRAGRRIQIKHWSVKLQRHGIRRTLKLHSTSRWEAAMEARELYRIICTQGWDALSSQGDNGSGLDFEPADASLDKADPAYWRLRLVQRANPVAPHEVGGSEYSVRIEHAGRAQYFPLGTLDSGAGAEKALEIYRVISKRGWPAAAESFRRELTVALHWSENPLAWTYATFHTLGLDRSWSAARFSALKSNRIGVVIIDEDAGVRGALAECIDRTSKFACAGVFASVDAMVRNSATPMPALVLINRGLHPWLADPWVAWSRVRADVPVLYYGIYEDSDEVFRATPGGASGYFLKRTSPNRLLDPILDALEDSKLSREKMPFSIQHYFQIVVHLISKDEAARELEKLTQREHEILNLLSKGAVDKEIAGALGISGWTVHGHLKKIFEKLVVHTRTEAAIKYLQK